MGRHSTDVDSAAIEGPDLGGKPNGPAMPDLSSGSVETGTTSEPSHDDWFTPKRPPTTKQPPSGETRAAESAPDPSAPARGTAPPDMPSPDVVLPGPPTPSGSPSRPGARTTPQSPPTPSTTSASTAGPSRLAPSTPIGSAEAATAPIGVDPAQRALWRRRRDADEPRVSNPESPAESGGFARARPYTMDRSTTYGEPSRSADLRRGSAYTNKESTPNGGGTGQTDTLVVRGLFGRVKHNPMPGPADLPADGQRRFRVGGDSPPTASGLAPAKPPPARPDRPPAVPDDRPAVPPVEPPHKSRGAAIVRGVGELLIALGVVILLFCVYQLFYTNLESNRAQAKIKNGLERDWTPPQHDPDAKPVPDDFSGIGEDDAFALMHIPRLGSDWEKPILEGVSLDDLARGLGHYPDSAMPGKVGNFAVAGHRATHGEPFRNLDRLEAGDVVIVETENSWYRYVIDRHQIVDPTNVGVVLPVPNEPEAEPTEKLITLTTCHPRWASTYRLIYWGHLESVMSKAAGTPNELLN